MAIKFLKDYKVGTPPETFTVGQVLTDRGDASELHFVRRGVAGYLQDDGRLLNVDGGEITDPTKPEPKEKAAKAAAAKVPAAKGAPKRSLKSPLAGKAKALAAPADVVVVEPGKASAAPPAAAVLGNVDLKQGSGS